MSLSILQKGVIRIQQYFPLVNYAIQSNNFMLNRLMIDNGLGLLASYLIRDGYNTAIFDYNNLKSFEIQTKEGKKKMLDEVVKELEEAVGKGAKIIGFKLYANGFSDVIKISKKLKQRRPDLLVVGGGPHVTMYGERIFSETDAFDILIVGEGDVSITKLAHLAYRGGSIDDIPNAIYRRNGEIRKTRLVEKGEINLEDLPFPVYRPEVYKNVEDKLIVPFIEESRGCSYGKCVFCAHPLINKGVRRRSVEAVVNEITHNEREYGVTYGRFAGSYPSPRFLNEIVKEKPNFKFSAFGRADARYDFEQLEGSLISLFFGLESANEYILKDVLNKTKNPRRYLQRIKETVKKGNERGISSVTSMIVPSPFDTEETIKETLSFVIELAPDFVPTLALAPLVGSPAYFHALVNGSRSGILLEAGFVKKFMLLELDLLKRPEEWAVPWKLFVDGKFQDPFVVTQKFIDDLSQHDLFPLSDDAVLLTYIYNNGLSRNQQERRKQCLDFYNSFRDKWGGGDVEGVRNIVRVLDKNRQGNRGE